MNSVKPISPKEVAAYKGILFPDFVFESFNELIAEKFDRARLKAIVSQNDVVARITEKAAKQQYATDVDAQLVFNNSWLNVEDVYEQHGWKVQYDKPGWGETGSAIFTFTAK